MERNSSQQHNLKRERQLRGWSQDPQDAQREGISSIWSVSQMCQFGIQTSTQSVPSMPLWLGEAALLARHKLKGF